MTENASQLAVVEKPSGFMRPVAARAALMSPEWKRWMDERRKQIELQVSTLGGRFVAGRVVRPKDYNDQLTIIEFWEDYLRMAQMDQRSKMTFVFENGSQVGKPVIDMTFDDYLRDAARTVQWRINKEIPSLRKLDEEGGIGISSSEAEFSVKFLRRIDGSIKKYFELPESKRLVYV